MVNIKTQSNEHSICFTNKIKAKIFLKWLWTRNGLGSYGPVRGTYHDHYDPRSGSVVYYGMKVKVTAQRVLFTIII